MRFRLAKGAPPSGRGIYFGRQGLRLSLTMTVVAIFLVGCMGPSSKAISNAFGRCVKVPGSLVEKIQERLHYVAGKASLREARAVHSKDFDEVYLVSSDIEGEWLEKSRAIATWAAVGSLENPSAVLSVDGLARQFSDWPVGETFNPGISMSSDGVQPSRICASGAADPLDVYKSPSTEGSPRISRITPKPTPKSPNP